MYTVQCVCTDEMHVHTYVPVVVQVRCMYCIVAYCTMCMAVGMRFVAHGRQHFIPFTSLCIDKCTYVLYVHMCTCMISLTY